MAPRVLMLCYHFHPSPEVGAKRANALARFLANEGSAPIVISASTDPRDPSTTGGTEVPEFARSIRIQKSGPGLIKFLARLKKQILNGGPLDRADTQVSGGPTHTEESKPTLLTTIKNFFFAVVYLIDENKRWSVAALWSAIKRTRKHRPDLIFASGPPMSPLAAAMLTARYMRIPVILDFRDPCDIDYHDGTPAAKFSAWVLRNYERWLVRNAHAVVCTAPSLADLLRDRYPERSASVHYIPNGFDGNPVERRPPSGHLDILFAGAIYLNRDPFIFLQAVSKMLMNPSVDPSKVRVTFVGECEEYNGRNLKSWLSEKPAGKVTRVLPKVAQTELRSFFDDATVLLNLAQRQPMAVPAKSFEQLASGKEVLFICEQDSDTARLVEGIPGVYRVDCDDVDGMQSVLQEMYVRHVEKKITAAPDSSAIGKFSRQEQNKRLLEVLSSCLT